MSFRKNASQTVARLALATLAALGLAAALPRAASAQADGSAGYTFESFSLPGATQTYAMGINDLGQITGFYVDAAGAYHGYTLNARALRGTYSQPTAFTPYNAGANTALGAINDFGQALGGTTDANGVTDVFEVTPWGRVSLRPADAYSSILFQNGLVYEGGLNDGGLYDSAYGDASGVNHGFVGFVDFFGRPHTKTVDYPYPNHATPPPGLGTELFGNNDYGQVVGAYRVSTAQRHDFLYDALTGRFTDLKISAANTNYSFLPYDINNAGAIVGRYVYFDGINGYLPFGFVETPAQQKTGQYTAVNPPNASAAIIVGVDDSGDLVGFYQLNDDPTYGVYAFLATPKAAPGGCGGR